MNDYPKSLIIIAGKGAYPRILAKNARAQGITRIEGICFRGETDRSIEKLLDKAHWLHMGQLAAMLSTMKSTGITRAVMAGQITPTNLFF